MITVNDPLNLYQTVVPLNVFIKENENNVFPKGCHILFINVYFYTRADYFIKIQNIFACLRI